MTTTSNPETTESVPVETVTATIDGYQITVPKGTLIIRAAELMGVQIPRFCDHPLLEPVAMCRMCLVEVTPGPPKPQPACAVPLADGMEVKTQHTSQMADEAQEGVLEFILANHPLDCPICDKGGECPLQNQAMSDGRAESRYTLPKATFPKPINVSSQVLLDRERCVNCARCTRFADQIAGDPFIALLERGAKQQVGISEDQPFDSYFSGNTIQICPVGALTSAKYRFRSRPFDLVSVPTTCEHCASGCALRTDYRRGTVMRRQAWDDPEVNEEWNCDKGRFAFPYLSQNRLDGPLVREDGQLRPASWPEALAVAAKGLAQAHGGVAALLGGRLTNEDAFAYQALLRTLLGSDHLDFRSRPHSLEETAALGSRIAGAGAGVSYADLERANRVLLVGLEPEEESPIIFLRLRKAVRRNNLTVTSIGPLRSTGLEKLAGELVEVVPGEEAQAVHDLAAADTYGPDDVILVGERASEVTGLWTALLTLTDRSGARLAWVPRRAGERGTLDAGGLAGVLPGGMPIGDEAARNRYAEVLGIDADVVPSEPGLDEFGIIAAVRADAAEQAQATDAEDDDRPTRRIRAMLVAGIDPRDSAQSDDLREVLAEVPFLVSLEQRETEVAKYADVILPVAGVTEKAGTFTNWEGRPRPFSQVFRDSTALSDARILAMLADAVAGELDTTSPMQRGDLISLRDQMAALQGWDGARIDPPQVNPAGRGDGPVLASWRLLLDLGVMQEGEPYLAGTARPAQARMSAQTAEALGVAGEELVSIGTERGQVTLPVQIADVADSVVWVPRNSAACAVLADLGAGWGDTVRIGKGGAA